LGVALIATIAAADDDMPEQRIISVRPSGLILRGGQTSSVASSGYKEHLERTAMLAEAEAISRVDLDNDASVHALEKLVLQCNVAKAPYCDQELVQNLTNVIKNNLLPQAESIMNQSVEHLSAQIGDFPLEPVEVQYTIKDFNLEWQKHMDCRLLETAMGQDSSTCNANILSLQQAKDAACNSSASFLEDDSLSYSCERSEKETKHQYLRNIVTMLGSASKELAHYKANLRSCENATQAYDEKKAECDELNVNSETQARLCDEVQIQMEYYACVRWMWQEQCFAQCDEHRHSIQRSRMYIRERLQTNAITVSKLWDMLCMLNETYCGTTYNGPFDVNVDLPEPPDCRPVTEEHPCTETWTDLLVNSFPRVATCGTCWGKQSEPPSPAPTQFPTQEPSPGPTSSPTAVTCDLFENPEMDEQARVNFLLKQVRDDNTTLGIVEEFVRQWAYEVPLTSLAERKKVKKLLSVFSSPGLRGRSSVSHRQA
jgi:hypothetical protein